MTKFFDNYVDEGGASFIGKDEKAVLVKNKTVLPIVRAYAFTDTGNYPGPAQAVVVDLDGEERRMSFKTGTVETRDRMIEAMIAYFDENGDDAEPVEVVLERAGNAFLLRDANAA